MDSKFPQIKREIINFIEDEEGNITRGKMLTVGSLVVLMGLIAGIDAYAKHSSHKSHSSHSSTSYHRSHVSHTSHKSSNSHSSHGSHGSHSNTHGSHSSHSSHSNTHSSHGSHSSHSNVTTTEATTAEITTKVMEEITEEITIIEVEETATSLPAIEQTSEIASEEAFCSELATNVSADVNVSVVAESNGLPQGAAIAGGVLTTGIATATVAGIVKHKKNKK